jgi:phage terminase large subunit GpA-like protein
MLSASSATALDRFVDRIRPEPILLVSEWSDRHRILPSKGSSEPGPWRTSRTPYLRDILDALSTGSPYHTVVFAKGSQIGASEAGLNWLAYCIHHAPAPMLMVQPTLEMCKRISKQRIQPMIDVTPVLSERIAESRARDAGNTLFQKDFPAGTFIMTGANSATGLRSMPARYLFLDEVDAYPGDVEGEGDPIELAIARTATFKRNRKIYLCSTPTIEGQSRIWTAFENTDQRYFHVPCPECDGYQSIEWPRIVWDENNPDTASMVCLHCGVLINERHKGWMLSRGRWTATAETHDPHVVGFHLSSLYAPPGWYSWADAARDFVKAKGNPDLLKSFINTKLGQCWEDRSGEKIDATGLMARREQWDRVPDDVVLITAGVDVQGDRLEVSIVGYTSKEQARVLHHLRLYGNPGEPAIWQTLDDLLMQPLLMECGDLMSIRAACIDSGGHHTQEVYKFCGERVGRRIMAIKGRAGALPIWPTKLSRKKLWASIPLRT